MSIVLSTLNMTSKREQLLMQHDMKCYHGLILRSFVKNTPTVSSIKALPEIIGLKPDISSVSFHRHGKELAITVTGENLWFCNKVQVESLKQVIKAENISQRSIQFNSDIKDKLIHISGLDYVKVKVWSHFLSAPVSKPKVEVKHKTYLFTYRQEQLAKLTPSELIETAYLSALLEQHPHNKTQSFSQRFETLRSFLEKVVSVVPIESLVYAIAFTRSRPVALKCCQQLMASKLVLQPSITLKKSFYCALYELKLDHVHPSVTMVREDSPLISNTKPAKKDTERIWGEKKVKKEIKRRIKDMPPLKALVMKEGSFWDSYVYHDKSYPNSEFKFLVKHYNRIAAHDCDSAICNVDLRNVYPHEDGVKNLPLKSPLHILKEGRKKLHLLISKSAKIEDSQSLKQLTEPDITKMSELYNAKMLEIVNEIREKDLKICTLLLGAFMEEQIRVPLMKTSFDTARAIEIATSAAALGVWAMFSLSLGDISGFLSAIPSKSLLVEVSEYIRGVFKQETIPADENYAGKLQFMVQGLDDTVSCNSHYVSYSLERQLLELCKDLKINESTPLDTLINDWDEIFKDNVLSLVASSHRSLIARWLKWALMVHHLREELAHYTAVGVVGLVNSGKSLLVSTLFDIKIPVGTTATKRTTVPFLYNLDEVVDGLDIIDFPGVDDRDETIPDLAELLLSIAQVVIFVVDYRKAHTESAKKWLEMLEDKSVPVLMCLTYADKLYAEHMGRDGSHPEPKFIKEKIGRETEMIVEQLGQVPSRKVQFFSFNQDRDSILNSAEGRKKLKEAGIGTPQGVGDWLADIFESQMDQDELAKKLRDLVYRTPD